MEDDRAALTAVSYLQILIYESKRLYTGCRLWRFSYLRCYGRFRYRCFLTLKKPMFMNAIKNKVQLIGFLGQVPDVKTIGDGKKVAHLSVATNETYKNAKGERVTETQWHTVIAWGKLAEIAEKYLVKGTEVAIEGKLINRNYTDKQGVKRYVTEVQANELLILTKKA